MAAVFQQGFALVVGVGDDLPNTIDDAKGLANILKDEGRCAYPANQVNLLVSEAATRENILSGLDNLAQTSNPDATVTIYFSGHGYHVETSIGSQYYLLPYGYDLKKLHKTAMNGGEFAEKLRAIPAKKLLILLDCCHAGGVGDAKVPGLELTKAPLPPEALNFLQEGRGRVLIASCKEDELSYAFPSQTYSVFTRVLMEALCGEGVAKKDGYVRVSDIALHCREIVPQRTKDKQHPILHWEESDNFVVAYYASGEKEPKLLPDELIQGQSQTTEQNTMSETNSQPQASQSGGFNQTGWKVKGDVYQAARDIVIQKENKKKD